jgi:hypothetical protein
MGLKNKKNKMIKFFLYIGVALVLLMAIKLLFRKMEIAWVKNKKMDGGWGSFFLREGLMDKKEKEFFDVLSQNLGDDFLVFSKVRIEDFIGVDSKGLRYGENGGKRNRIKSYHVDFLICDKNITKPLMVVELDGSSHKRLDRIERDERFNRLYEKVGLNFQHIKIGDNFEEATESIREELLKKNKK